MADIRAANIISQALTSLLNTKIDVMTVYDEMFLIEHGMVGKDAVLNQYIKKIMKDYMTNKLKTNQP